MTPSYVQIQKQIEALQQKADKLRQQEIGGVISRIKEAIAHYGLSPEQLGFGAKSGAAAVRTAKASSSRAAKFADGQGNSWSGRGPRPHWLRDALAAGRRLEEFATGSAPAKGAAARKRKTKHRYRDDAGHSWSGMGPRPRWLKEALDAGKTLEELSA